MQAVNSKILVKDNTDSMTEQLLSGAWKGHGISTVPK